MDDRRALHSHYSARSLFSGRSGAYASLTTSSKGSSVQGVRAYTPQYLAILRGPQWRVCVCPFLQRALASAPLCAVTEYDASSICTLLRLVFIGFVIPHSCFLSRSVSAMTARCQFIQQAFSCSLLIAGAEMGCGANSACALSRQAQCERAYGRSPIGVPENCKF